MKYYVAGHSGLAGSAILRNLLVRDEGSLIKGHDEIVVRSHSELNLEDRDAVALFFTEESPDVVILAAGRVGGIEYNVANAADMLLSNARIAMNVMEAAHRNGVKRLVYLSSSCAYPVDCTIPLVESYMGIGTLERTNKPYATAKLLGTELCSVYGRLPERCWLTLVPCNLYGVKDTYSERSHVIPALIRKLHAARGKSSIELLGTGRALREFLWAADLAYAVVRAATLPAAILKNHNILNVGSSQEVSVATLAHLIADIVGYSGELVFNGALDGVRTKLMCSDVSRALGLFPDSLVSLETGLQLAYDDYLHRYPAYEQSVE